MHKRIFPNDAMSKLILKKELTFALLIAKYINTHSEKNKKITNPIMRMILAHSLFIITL